MNGEFIPHEQALELKQLGFNEPCWAWWHIEDCDIRFCYSEQRSPVMNSNETEIVGLPTYSQAFKWFREYQDLHKEILLDRTSYPKYCIQIHMYKDFGNYEKIEIIDDWFLYKKYEEAELACLIKLIEIVKNEKDESDDVSDYLQSEQFKKDFADQVKKDTWENGLPMVYMNKEGWIVKHWQDGRIEKLEKIK